MKYVRLLFLPVFALFFSVAGAETIKKASAVKVQEQDAMTAATSTDLIGTAISVFSGIQNLKKQEEVLSNECAPSDADVSYVNKMVQEYAKIGEKSSSDLFNNLPVKTYNKSTSYANSVAMGEGSTVYYDAFVMDDDGIEDRTDGKDNKIWYEYPKASKAHKCPPEKPNCAESEKRWYSNLYEVYGAMGWNDADLLSEEASVHAKLMEKYERCAPDILKRKKQEMTGQLITDTIGSVGKKQNTGNVMQQVQGLTQSMGGGGIGDVVKMGSGLLPTIIPQ